MGFAILPCFAGIFVVATSDGIVRAHQRAEQGCEIVPGNHWNAVNFDQWED